ncbi:hypothetical protein AB0D10_04965 [Kitasatospora sp. NPDC048545]|uniref:hypothetical protein n=1 Tax=Kitasatospora sp. NPDC048545 TaxID=3157208 RepID=UPI0033D1BFEA
MVIPPTPVRTAAEYRPLRGTPIQISVTSEQPHGRACIHDAEESGALVPAGHVYTPTSGSPLGWPVVAHPQCIEETAHVEH